MTPSLGLNQGRDSSLLDSDKMITTTTQNGQGLKKIIENLQKKNVQ